MKREKALIILGSARREANTREAVARLAPFPDYELIDLRELNILPYDYARTDEDDDFRQVARKMADADIIVFATPVYWYSMSGLMKTFFDRLTELITLQKPLGRALRGKKTYLIACGTDPALPPGFEVPFQLTSRYFDMEYVRAFYLVTASPSG